MMARLFVPVLALAVGFSPGQVDGLSFSPENGSTVTKSFSEEVSWTLDSMEQSFGGQSIPQEMPDMSSRVTRTAVVTDQYVEVGDGRPSILKRTVDQASGSMEGSIEAGGGSEDYDYELESELTEQVLMFVWKPDDEIYECTLEDGAPGGPELERLREDMDLRALLPDGDVSEGDEWTIDSEALLDVFALGGDFNRLPSGFEGEGIHMMEIEDALAASLLSLSESESEIDGKLTAKWSETIEVDGRKLALIKLDTEASIEVDLAARLTQFLDESGFSSQREDASLAFTCELDGAGELLWDLEAGRFHSFELNSNATITIDMGWSQGGGEIVASFGLSGQHVLKAKAEAE